jgi:hypothetical protein
VRNKQKVNVLIVAEQGIREPPHNLKVRLAAYPMVTSDGVNADSDDGTPSDSPLDRQTSTARRQEKGRVCNEVNVAGDA